MKTEIVTLLIFNFWVPLSRANVCTNVKNLPHVANDYTLEGLPFIYKRVDGFFHCVEACKMLARCKAFTYNTFTNRCNMYPRFKYSSKASDDGLLVSPIADWTNQITDVTKKPGQVKLQRACLLITDSGAIYVYSMMNKTWSLANKKGAHIYGFLLDASRRRLYTTKYGKIMTSSLSGELLSSELSFKELVKISNESIHGLTGDWIMEYMFTLGKCTDGRQAVIRVKTDGSGRRCITFFSKKESYFEDKIVADQRARVLYLMSSFEKKLTKCDYNGESQKTLVSWRANKIIDITFNEEMGTLVYVSRRKLFVMNHQDQLVRQFRISDLPRCVFTIDRAIVVMHGREGRILTGEGVTIAKIVENKKHHFQSCIGVHSGT